MAAAASSSARRRRLRRRVVWTRGGLVPTPRAPLLILALAALLLTLALSPSAPSPLVGAAAADDRSDDHEDDLLAEILAEEARREEEHAKLEAEAREYEAARAREYSGGGGDPGTGGGGEGGGGGGPKMRPRGTMPRGAAVDLGSAEEEILRREVAARAERAAEEERRAAEEAERRAEERERKFESDLAGMDAQRKRAARRRKARDAAAVRRILRAAERGRHYAVLGLRNWDVRVGPLRLFRATSGDVKRAYRNLARTVHPDKNRDGRAEQAFHAVEHSAAVLGDDEKRREYDRRVGTVARRRRKERVRAVVEAVEMLWKSVKSVWVMAKKVLGPFSTPILVLGFIII